MSDNYIEKAFLYLVALSVLLHAAFFALVILLPQKKELPRQEPYTVELRDLPPSMAPAKPEKPVRRLDQERRRVTREVAPPGEMESQKPSAMPIPAIPRTVPQPERRIESPSQAAENGETPPRETPASGDFFRKKEKATPDVAKLFPSAEKLAKMEEGYRKKYGPEVAEGDTTFLNTDDIQFGSFLRRFESAVYGVWRYPAEAARMGIEGVTPVKISFNRKGEIEKVEVLESSGSRILDEEVRRTLKAVGPIGGFPKRYDKDQFNLIAFFHYGLVRGKIQGTIY